MKKVFRLGIMMVMGLFLTACQSNNADMDQTAIASYLEDLKTGNFASAESRLETVPENFAYNDNEVMKKLFERMTYEIKDTKVSGDEAVAEVYIKIPNTALIYDDMMNNIGAEVQKLQAGDDSSKTKASGMMVEYLLTKLTEEDVVMVENTVKVTLRVLAGKTVVVPDADLSKALSGVSVSK